MTVLWVCCFFLFPFSLLNIPPPLHLVRFFSDKRQRRKKTADLTKLIITDKRIASANAIICKTRRYLLLGYGRRGGLGSAPLAGCQMPLSKAKNDMWSEKLAENI